MKTRGLTASFTAALAVLSLGTGSVASAAPAAIGTINPLVALSVFGTAQSRAALCVAGSASAAAAAAASTTAAQPAAGCVLPVVDAAPPPVVSEVPPPVAAAPYAPAYVAAGANLLPLLLSLGAFAAVFFLLDDEILGDGGGLELDLSPN